MSYFNVYITEKEGGAARLDTRIDSTLKKGIEYANTLARNGHYYRVALRTDGRPREAPMDYVVSWDSVEGKVRKFKPEVKPIGGKKARIVGALFDKPKEEAAAT